MKQFKIGYFYVLTIFYIAAVGSIKGIPTIAGFEYTGCLWVILLVLGPFLILYEKDRIPFPIILWLPWFGYVWLSLIWANGWERINLQDAFQITMPLVVGSVASVFVTKDSQLRSLRKSFNYSLLIMMGIFIVLSYGQIEGLKVGRRSMALTAVFFSCIFVAAQPAGFRQYILGCGSCFAITFMSQSRIATFAILVVLGAYPLYSRLTTKVYTWALILTLAVALFYTPIFQERLFGIYGGSGSLNDLIAMDFDTAGRFEVWPEIWTEAKKQIIIGAGVGEASKFIEVVWPGTGKCHNDYLRIIFEQGFIGLFCFAVVIVTQIYLLKKKLRFYNCELQYAFIASYLGFIALLVIMVTDNPILYNTWYVNPLFAMLGAAYGVASRQTSVSKTEARCQFIQHMG